MSAWMMRAVGPLQYGVGIDAGEEDVGIQERQNDAFDQEGDVKR